MALEWDFIRFVIAFHGLFINWAVVVVLPVQFISLVNQGLSCSLWVRKVRMAMATTESKNVWVTPDLLNTVYRAAKALWASLVIVRGSGLCSHPFPINSFDCHREIVRKLTSHFKPPSYKLPGVPKVYPFQLTCP